MSNTCDQVKRLTLVNSSGAAQDGSTERFDQTNEDNDNPSDYFADADTSSCDSFDDRDETSYSEMSQYTGTSVILTTSKIPLQASQMFFAHKVIQRERRSFF